MEMQKNLMIMIYQMEALASAVADLATGISIHQEDRDQAQKVMSLIYLLEEIAVNIRNEAEHYSDSGVFEM